MPVQLGGYELPPESAITIVPYIFHRNPDVFTDPEAFKPERFQNEPPKNTYLPLGVGPRVCIGQHLAMNEMMLAVATILPRCRVTLHDGYEATPDPLLTLTPRDGLPATVVRR